MILLLDIGNTRIKWATAADGRLHPGRAQEHGGHPADALDGLELQDAGSVWVSQVLGFAAEAELSEKIQARFGPAPHFARTQAEHAGLRVAYAEPERLGVDRWLSMLALWIERQQAFCVVNAGTALTFDAVDEGGQHLGGLIAPGLATAQNAIQNATRFDLRPQAARYTTGLGKDTETCVRQGALHAGAGLVERGARLAAGARVITGGDASDLLPHLGSGWDWRPNLVLEGLQALARSEGA